MFAVREQHLHADRPLPTWGERLWADGDEGQKTGILAGLRPRAVFVTSDDESVRGYAIGKLIDATTRHSQIQYFVSPAEPAVNKEVWNCPERMDTELSQSDAWSLRPARTR